MHRRHGAHTNLANHHSQPNGLGALNGSTGTYTEADTPRLRRRRRQLPSVEFHNVAVTKAAGHYARRRAHQRATSWLGTRRCSAPYAPPCSPASSASCPGKRCDSSRAWRRHRPTPCGPSCSSVHSSPSSAYTFADHRTPERSLAPLALRLHRQVGAGLPSRAPMAQNDNPLPSPRRPHRRRHLRTANAHRRRPPATLPPPLRHRTHTAHAALCRRLLLARLRVRTLQAHRQRCHSCATRAAAGSIWTLTVHRHHSVARPRPSSSSSGRVSAQFKTTSRPSSSQSAQPARHERPSDSDSTDDDSAGIPERHPSAPRVPSQHRGRPPAVRPSKPSPASNQLQRPASRDKDDYGDSRTDTRLFSEPTEAPRPTIRQTTHTREPRPSQGDPRRASRRKFSTRRPRYER